MGTITITEIKTKPKRSVIFTADGRQFGCWTDRLPKLGLERGASYNIETEDFETNNGNVLTNIISARRVPIGPEGERFTSGAFRGPAPAAPETRTTPAAAGQPFRNPEQMFVEAIIAAYIGNGKCPPEKLSETIGYVRRAWNNHWGEEHREAAE